MSDIPRKSFEVVYKSLALPLTKFIVKRTGGNQDMVDEVFSRTVTAAWEGFNSFERKSSYFTWLCRIALNKIADYYREQVNQRSKFIVPLLEDIAFIRDTRLSPSEKFALDELRASVRACISLLPQDKKQLLLLRYWKDMTIKEIAKISGLSERAVEGKLYRSRKKLENILSLENPEIVEVYEKVK